MPILRTKSPRRHCAFRAGWAADSCAGDYNFPFCTEKDTSFPRRMVPRGIPGAFGGIFLRRRLQFSIPRRKRYPIPAQNGATGRPGRIGRRIPAQAATIFPSAPKRIPHSRAERCHVAARAHLGAFSCAGGYIFPFRAEKDTSFLRRTVPRGIPGRFGGRIPRRMAPRSIWERENRKFCAVEVPDAVFFGLSMYILQKKW